MSPPQRVVRKDKPIRRLLLLHVLDDEEHLAGFDQAQLAARSPAMRSASRRFCTRAATEVAMENLLFICYMYQ